MEKLHTMNLMKKLEYLWIKECPLCNFQFGTLKCTSYDTDQGLVHRTNRSSDLNIDPYGRFCKYQSVSLMRKLSRALGLFRI